MQKSLSAAVRISRSLRVPGIRWRLLDLQVIREQGGALCRLASALERLHQSEVVDVVLCVQHAMVFRVSRVAGRAGLPTILVSHGDIFDHPLTAFSLPTTCFYRAAARHAYREATAVFTVARAMCDVAVVCGADPARVFHMPNGVEAAEIGWPPSRVVPRDGRYQALCVGRCEPEKGHHKAVAALAQLGDLDLHLRVIGDGSCRAELQALAQRLGVAHRCSFVGRLARTELASHYAGADLLIQPSLSEASPLAVLEARLCGLPVVGSRAGDIPLLLAGARNCAVVPPGDAHALAGAVREVLENALVGQSADSPNAPAFPFHWDKVLTRFRSLVEAVATGHPCEDPLVAQA